MQGYAWRASPPLNLRDTVIDIFHPQAGGDSKPSHPTQLHKHHDPFGGIDYVPPNARLFSMRTALYISEENEAVNRQVNKGRSPTLRHISRTHRVDLDWLYDRISLDPMIQIKYVNTTEQFADTRGSLTRDRWTQLTVLVNERHTTLTQSNLSVSSAVVNLEFSSMRKRAREALAASASKAQQRLVHGTALFARWWNLHRLDSVNELGK